MYLIYRTFILSRKSTYEMLSESKSSYTSIWEFSEVYFFFLHMHKTFQVWYSFYLYITWLSLWMNKILCLWHWESKSPCSWDVSFYEVQFSFSNFNNSFSHLVLPIPFDIINENNTPTSSTSLTFKGFYWSTLKTIVLSYT